MTESLTLASTSASRCNASSARVRSVTSWIVPKMRTGLPASS